MFFLFACSCYKKKELSVILSNQLMRICIHTFSNDKKFSVTVLMYQY